MRGLQPVWPHSPRDGTIHIQGWFFFLPPSLETRSQTCPQPHLGDSRCCQVDSRNHHSPRIKRDFILLSLGLGERWLFSVHASFSPLGSNIRCFSCRAVLVHTLHFALALGNVFVLACGQVGSISSSKQ